MPINDKDMTWKDLEIGCMISDTGNTLQYKTGDWRSQCPTYDFARCIRCGLCYIFCPEGCVHQNESGHFVADLFFCKGCAICAKECPTKVISMVVEEDK